MDDYPFKLLTRASTGGGDYVPPSKWHFIKRRWVCRLFHREHWVKPHNEFGMKCEKCLRRWPVGTI